MKRLISGIQFGLVHGFMMFIVSYLLGGEPNWTSVIGFALGGFTFGLFIKPYMEKRRRKKSA